MTNNYRATLILIAGWGLFFLCLLLPALITKDKIYPGWYAGYLAFDSIFYFKPKFDWLQYAINGIGNMISLFIIFSTGVNNKKYFKIIALLFLLFAFMSLTYVLEYELNNLGSGYYVWVISLFTIAYAHYITYKFLSSDSSK